MDHIKTSGDQITIFYNPGDTTQEKSVAHAKGTGKEVLAIPYEDAPTAYNVWTTIWEQIPGDKNSIFDENDERYADLIEGREFEFEDWRKLITHNPTLVKSAIAISGEKVVVIDRPSEIHRLQELGPQGAQTPEENVDDVEIKIPG